MTNETREEMERVWHNTANSAKYYDGECCHDIAGVEEAGWYFMDEGYQHWGPYATQETARRHCFGYWTHMIEPVHLRFFKDMDECFKFCDEMEE